MSELLTTRIRGHAARLTLPHLGENLETLLARAEADTMGYLEFVDLLLGEEVGVREGRRFRTALKLSALEADIRNWIKLWNEDPKPYVWTKTADEILESLARYCQRISGAGH